MEVGKGRFKRVWATGRVISDGKGDAEYVIETFPNQLGENKIKCEDCGKVDDSFIRVYKPVESFVVEYKTVCQMCVKNKYA